MLQNAGGGSDCYHNTTGCMIYNMLQVAERCTATDPMSAAETQRCGSIIIMWPKHLSAVRSPQTTERRVPILVIWSLVVLYVSWTRGNTRQPFSIFPLFGSRERKVCTIYVIHTIRPRGVVVSEARRALQRDAPAGHTVVEHPARSVRHSNPSVPACFGSRQHKLMFLVRSA